MIVGTGVGVGVTITAWISAFIAGGGNPTGIFQYLPDTWREFSARAGLPGASIWDPEAQAHVTAWAFANGLSSHWECK